MMNRYDRDTMQYPIWFGGAFALIVITALVTVKVHRFLLIRRGELLDCPDMSVEDEQQLDDTE